MADKKPAAQDAAASNKDAIAQIGRDQAARAGVTYQEVDSVPVSAQDPSEAYQGEPPQEVESLDELPVEPEAEPEG